MFLCELDNSETCMTCCIVILQSKDRPQSVFFAKTERHAVAQVPQDPQLHSWIVANVSFTGLVWTRDLVRPASAQPISPLLAKPLHTVMTQTPTLGKANTYCRQGSCGKNEPESQIELF